MLKEDLMKEVAQEKVAVEAEAKTPAAPVRQTQKMAFTGILDYHDKEYAAKDRKAARRRRRQLIARFVDTVVGVGGQTGETMKDGDIYTTPFNTSEGWGGQLHVSLHPEGEGNSPTYKVVAQIDKQAGPVELQLIKEEGPPADEAGEEEKEEEEEGESSKPRRKKKRKGRKKRGRSPPQPLSALKGKLETTGYGKNLMQDLAATEGVELLDAGDHQWLAYDLLVLFQEWPMASQAANAIRARLTELKLPFQYLCRLGGTLIGVGPVKLAE